MTYRRFGSSRKSVGEFGGPKVLPSALGAGEKGVAGSRESGILRACLCAAAGFGFSTRTASGDFDRTPRRTECSVTAMPESWSFIGAQENGVRQLWPLAPGLLRPEAQAGPRSLVRGRASIPRHRRATRRLRSVRRRSRTSPRSCISTGTRRPDNDGPHRRHPVSCRTGCRRGTPAALASPSRPGRS
jgi:hypothetical protein